jgi:zinc protease
MRNQVLAALLGCLAVTGSAAQEIPEIPFTRYVLPNGLTLIVHEDHKAPIVAVNVWYHVGSKNERAAKTGFAHLFEHLMFNGSENFNDDYFKVLERIGATDLNGTTSEDRTNYFQTVPVSALDTVLWMESDRMGHLLGAISQARLDEQRGVVKNEKRQGENEPYGRVWDVMTPSLYPKGHPYSWSVIGSMEDLDGAKLDDVKEWFRTYYGASNATLVIAGDVKPEDVKARVERFFGDVPPGPPLERYEAWVAKRTGEQRQVLRDRVPQARLYMVWNTPEWGTQDDTLLSMAAQILSPRRCRGRARSARPSSSRRRRARGRSPPRWRGRSARSWRASSRRGRRRTSWIARGRSGWRCSSVASSGSAATAESPTCWRRGRSTVAIPPPTSRSWRG